MANAAQTWANKCVFQHSGGTLGPYGGTKVSSVLLLQLLLTKRNYAENLAAGTGSGYGIQQAVQSWTNEACLSMMSL